MTAPTPAPDKSERCAATSRSGRPCGGLLGHSGDHWTAPRDVLAPAPAPSEGLDDAMFWTVLNDAMVQWREDTWRMTRSAIPTLVTEAKRLRAEVERLTKELADADEAVKIQRDEIERHVDGRNLIEAWKAAETAEARVATLEAALREIADPVKFMRGRAEAAGDKLEPIYARMLSEDHYFLKSIARAALEAK